MAIRVTLYVQDGCGYCVKAKELATMMQRHMNVAVTIKPINDITPRDIELVSLKNRELLGFVPIILINEVCIGGYTELQQWYDTNWPPQLCQQCRMCVET